MFKPTCYLVLATAPYGTRASDANQAFNTFVADTRKGLVLFHDHFSETPRGGFAVTFIDSPTALEALRKPGPLESWDLRVHPLVFTRNPAGFDAQTEFTLRTYRNLEWETLRKENRPAYGNLS